MTEHTDGWVPQLDTGYMPNPPDYYDDPMWCGECNCDWEECDKPEEHIPMKEHPDNA